MRIQILILGFKGLIINISVKTDVIYCSPCVPHVTNVSDQFGLFEIYTDFI